jgi:capsular exopolysaccharide synthesis family protein
MRFAKEDVTAMKEQSYINPALRTSLEPRASGQDYGGIEVQEENATAGNITGTLRPDDHLISLLSPATMEAEQYRTLSLMLEQRRQSGLLQVVAVTSPTVGDGKTLTSINLAGAFAQSRDARVLLIDVDFRKPSIPERLGLKDANMRGFRDAIVNPALRLRDIAHHLPAWNLSVVTVGRTEVMPHESFKSSRFAELVDEARHDFEWIILDSAPLLQAPDCLTIGRSVDGFVMVVCAHKTSRKDIGEALDILGPSKLLGLVFNNDENFVRSHKFHPYYLQSKSR